MKLYQQTFANRSSKDAGWIKLLQSVQNGNQLVGFNRVVWVVILNVADNV